MKTKSIRYKLDINTYDYFYKKLPNNKRFRRRYLSRRVSITQLNIIFYGYRVKFISNLNRSYI